MVRVFLSLIFIQILLISGLIIFQPAATRKANFDGKKAVVMRFGLSDFCLSTESRHTRHIAFPEPIAPFQDLPAYHEHFPSSSFFQSPGHKSLNHK